MAGTVNKVILIGRVGRDPEVRYISSGTPVATFSVATDESFKSKNGEQQQHTEWHKVVAWNKLAEICGEYLTKGKLVYIEGSIRSRQWEDQSGNKRTAHEIVARNMQMLGSRTDAERAAAGGSRPAAAQGAGPEERDEAGPEPSADGEITDDDIPF
jgi:single-strand DNA-binding protein